MASLLTGKDLLPCRQSLRVLRVERADQRLLVTAESVAPAVCPTCQAPSASRHSQYERMVQDLPWQGVPVTLQLRLGRWRCRNRNCAQTIFAQRLAVVAAPRARRTARLDAIVQVVGHQLGGRPAETLMGRLGMPVSDDTLLRRVKRSTIGTGEPLRVVGVDDWAWKKHHHYGTILVDLERKKTVDLLPRRSADEVANWLQKHPGVEIVSRDRHGLYADGAARGAPQAKQVADRFHLILNLRQAVEQELSRQRQALVWPLASAPALSVPAPVPAWPPPACVTPDAVSVSATEPPPVSPVVQQRRQIAAERRAAKQVLFAEVRRLSLAGRRASQIVRDTGVKRRRVDQWIRQAELPERCKMEPRINSPAYFQEYLAQRWSEGCHHGRTLLKEIRGRGYQGGFSGLARFLSEWRPLKRKRHAGPVMVPPPIKAERRVAAVVPADLPAHRSHRTISPLVAAALLMKPRPHLTVQQGEKVDALKVACPDFAHMRSLVMSFRSILLGGKPESLAGWMTKAVDSGIYAMTRFARSLQQDWEAVQNAIAESWSNGPVEGHVNRLKTLKRQMYGRAGFTLLRARLLPWVGSSP